MIVQVVMVSCCVCLPPRSFISLGCVPFWSLKSFLSDPLFFHVHLCRHAVQRLHFFWSEVRLQYVNCGLRPTFLMFWFVVVMPSLCHVLFLYKIGTYLRRNFTFFCGTLFYIHTYFYRRFLLKSKYGGCFVFAFVFAVIAPKRCRSQCFTASQFCLVMSHES